MNERTADTTSSLRAVMPTHFDLFYGGAWHKPKLGRYTEDFSPATGETLARVAEGTAEDVDAAVAAARKGFDEWRRVPALERARILRGIADLIRGNAREMALLDSADGGNPVSEMTADARMAAAKFDYFAGLVTEMKGDTVPISPDVVNFSIRQPMGVVVRIVAFNHPFLFSAGKTPAPLAAGNALIIKAPEQAPLSTLRLAELIGGLLPPGTFNVLTGGRDLGSALTSHKGVAMVGLTGSVPTGRAVMRSAADTLKPVLLELGGKNALIALADADPDEVAAAAIDGLNLTWCGQSCGSTSRLFLHDSIHDAVVERIQSLIGYYKPGIPTDPATTMGSIISKAQHDRILQYIDAGKEGGARLLCGGKRPSDPLLSKGYFVEPTVFVDVTQEMRIASEEIFGPVLSVLRWQDEEQMLKDVNAVEYGLTCSIWTNDLRRAHTLANEVEVGYVWVNQVSKHFLGAPFGGFKQSGIGREESLSELLAFTQEKNIHINLKPRATAHKAK
ncbi:MAG: aldehyde dehydrogenase family protein [Pseudomonadota bacterium]|nr:aldehyde dehydrogenase family protein [Pseudomonadota bacterium]